ncbi:14978_t:CDS:2, partial [Gigaspora margarita]
PQQKPPTVTEVLNAYYIPDDPLEKTFNCAEFGPEDEKVVFELLQNLVVELDTPNNQAFEIIEKTAKMDHVNETFESSLENSIDVEKEPPWNYRKPAKMDKELTVQIKESVNKGIKISKNNSAAIAYRMDSNKEKKDETGKRIIINSDMHRINQGFGYLPMNWQFTPIFDPRGVSLCF